MNKEQALAKVFYVKSTGIFYKDIMKYTGKSAIDNIFFHIYLKINYTNKAKCINLLEYLIEKYPDAPGSSHNHQAYAGGYYNHISDILDYAEFLYESLSKRKKLDFTLSDAMLVLFLHDIEKPVKYCDSTIETDSQIRERLIKEFDFTLNEEHIEALKYIHGEGEDYRKDKRIMSPLCAFCHCCDIISARIFFE